MGGWSDLFSWTKDSVRDALLGRNSCLLASVVDGDGLVVCCFC